jgi:hypothetical protein
MASAANDNVGMGMAWVVPFEVWNVTTNERVALSVYDFGLDGVWDPWDLLLIVDRAYDAETDPFEDAWPYEFSWMFAFDDTVYGPSIGDVFTVAGPLMNSPSDVFTFSSDGIISSKASDQLTNIKVVPDPYYAHASWDVTKGESNLQFQNLPDECTIRIYTLSGEPVATLHRTEDWNLQSTEQRLVASGIYIYHVESRYGDRLGRFAVVN